jgi:type IV conjugative transfer system protein TraL
MESKLKTKINRSISHWLLFVFWEMDEVAIFMTPIIAFLPTKNLILGLVIGAVAIKLYTKIKYEKPVGYINHKLIKLGMIKLKKLPPAHYNYFFK